MKTFTEPKELEENPRYHEQRRRTLAGLRDEMLDAPIVGLINGFNGLPYCFTLQSCYGHFVYRGQKAPHNLEPLPMTDTISEVQYRIAYIAFCIEHSDSGRGLFKTLSEIPATDPANIQFCCAEWFWKRHVNTYALQVEPDKWKHEDKVLLDYEEALNIEKVRNRFFVHMKELLRRQEQ